MSVLTFAYLPGPKDFHEIARLCLVKVGEVLAKPQFMKETGSARPIRIPPAPDSFTIVLISNDKLFQSGKIEVKLTARAQGL